MVFFKVIGVGVDIMVEMVVGAGVGNRNVVNVVIVVILVGMAVGVGVGNHNVVNVVMVVILLL